MLKKLVSSILTVAMLMGVMTMSAYAVDYGEEYKNQPTKTYSQVFMDVQKSHWGFAYIGEMNDRGVITGYPNGYFYPENYVTRGEFSKIMCLAAGMSIEETYYSDYADVNSDDWFLPYVEAGKYYLNGYISDGQEFYRPNDNALREDIAVALVKLKGYSTVGADESILKAMFRDYQSISSNARKYVAAALENGLISGYEDNTFRGQDSITRAEAATLLWRAYQYGNENKVFDKDDTVPVASAETAKPVTATTPTPTAAPTTTPTTTPVVEQTPEESTPLPKTAYVCNTLANASIDNSFEKSTFDQKNNIYFYDSDKKAIYKLSLNDKKKSELLDLSDFTLEDVEITQKEVEKQVPKTIIKTVEKEVEVDDEIAENETDKSDVSDGKSDENITDTTETDVKDEPEQTVKKATKIVTEEVEETVYETVTEVVEEKTVKGVHKEFKLKQVYYNTYDNTLYFTGTFTRYATDTSLDEQYDSHDVLYKLDGSKANFVCELPYDCPTAIAGNLDDGRMVFQYGSTAKSGGGVNLYFTLLNIEDMSTQQIDNYWHNYKDIVFNSGNAIYEVQISQYSYGYLYKYIFATNKWEEVTSASGTFIGTKDKSVYFWDIEEGKIAKAETSGKIAYIAGIDTLNDVEVEDFKPMPTKYYTAYTGNIDTERLYISENYGYIFYDSVNKCFRAITKRK